MTCITVPLTSPSPAVWEQAAGVGWPVSADDRQGPRGPQTEAGREPRTTGTQHAAQWVIFGH